MKSALQLGPQATGKAPRYTPRECANESEENNTANRGSGLFAPALTVLLIRLLFLGENQKPATQISYRGSDANEARCQGSNLKRELAAISSSTKRAQAKRRGKNEEG